MVSFGALADSVRREPGGDVRDGFVGVGGELLVGHAGVCTIAGASVSFVSVGTCTVNANQAGSSTGTPHRRCSSRSRSRGQSDDLVRGAGDRRFDESPVTVGATASSGLPVAFSSTTPGVCSVAGTSVTFVSVGTCTVSADQGGDWNWNPAPQVQRSFQVLKGNQAVSFAALADKRLDESLTMVATASSGLTVSFSSATPAVSRPAARTARRSRS